MASFPAPPVLAAGVVVRRRGGELLLVHRPRYDDWSFPKGKLDPGEPAPVAAVREVLEETGLAVRLDVPLAPQAYPIRGGTKLVHYWTGRALGADDVAGYTRGSEIDRVAWLPGDEAAEWLTYPHDRETLRETRGLPRRVDTLIVLRHAKAVSRAEWPGADPDRPLSSRGARQSRALGPLLDTRAPDRVLTSPSARCRDTVLPWVTGTAGRVKPKLCPELSEEGASEEAVQGLVARLLGLRGTTVLCSHRPVLPHVFGALGTPAVSLAPGAALLVHHRAGTIVAVEQQPSPDD